MNDFREIIEAALSRQKAMNDAKSLEITEAERRELMEKDEQISGVMQAFQNMFGDSDEDDEIDEEDIQKFIDANPVPEWVKKHLMIGTLLNSANGEPRGILALTGGREDYRYSLRQNWGINGREDALEMLADLLKGRHSEAFDRDFAIIREHGAKNYLSHARNPLFDSDDIEIFEATVEGFSEILDFPPEYAQGCQTLYAWDLERIGLLARILAHVGYITADEAYGWLQKAGAKAAGTFDSWQDYFVSLLLGRALHLGITEMLFAMAYDLTHDSCELLFTYPIEALK